MLSPYGVWFLILGNSHLVAVGLLLFRLSRFVGLFRVILVLVFFRFLIKLKQSERAFSSPRFLI